MMTSKNSRLADFHGFFAAAGGVDAIALFAQDFAQQLARVLIVVHHQNVCGVFRFHGH